MMMRKIFVTILILMFSIALFSQNKVWLTDGRVFNASSRSSIDSGYVIVFTKKDKEKEIDTADVFAFISGNDTVFLYQNDDYPLDRAKMFMRGQIDGGNYKNTDVYAAAFSAGVLAPVLLNALKINNFLSPLVSGIFAASFAGVNVNKEQDAMNPKYKDNEDYKKGFKLRASREKVKNITIYSSAGLVTGILILYFIEYN